MTRKIEKDSLFRLKPRVRGVIKPLCFLIWWILLMALGATAATESPKQEIWYHTGYSGGLADPRPGVSALTGPTKMPLVFEAIWRDGLVEPSCIHTDSHSVVGSSPFASAIDLESLRAVHTDRYLKALFTGEPRSLATSQGLPTWNERVARGWLLNVGGLYAASEVALRKRGITANLGHGYHHATTNRGMGFCTLNGLVVVAKKLIREDKAKRVMIIDLDHHEGNGTAECIIGEPNIWNVSLYGSYMGGPPSAGNNHVVQILHEAFEKGKERDAHYLAVIADALPRLIQLQNPDLILYQAGMDPFDGAGISPEALAIRDAYVFALSLSTDKPVTWVLAGGYADMDTLVKLHTGTVRMANEVLRRIKRGQRIEHSGVNPYLWTIQNGAVQFPDWKSIVQKPFQVNRPPLLSNGEIKEFVRLREQLFRDEALPKDELASAYERLFDSRVSR